MNYPQAIYQRSLLLPESAAREVLDFIEFIATRHAPSNPTDLNDTQRFLRSLAPGWGADFPNDIDGSDLGADVPRDSL